jgi:AraC-like DNA-binding protein
MAGSGHGTATSGRNASARRAGIDPDLLACPHARYPASRIRTLWQGNLDQDGVARSLHQSASTLQRRLRAEGTSFQRLLDATRREQALEYL